MNQRRRLRAVNTAALTVSAMLTSASALPQAQLPQYQVLDIGTLGGNEASGVDINDLGEITGAASIADGFKHAFIYRNGKMYDLGTAKTDRYGSGDSSGADINNKGEIAGQAETDGGVTHAVRYSGTVVQDLGTLGGTFSSGYAINERGHVAGISYLTENSDYHAFAYSSDAGMSDLGTLGDSYSTGDGINDAGEVAGIYQLDFDSHAYLYTHGSLVDLVPGKSSYVSSTAVVINASGHVAGTYLGDDVTRSFLYRDGSSADIGTLGGLFTFASALNDADQVVGDATIAVGDTRAFRWTAGEMEDLGTLGGTYSNGFAINRSGQVTGQAVTAEGIYHPFVYSQGGMIDLGLPEGGVQGFGAAINASGQVTGTYQLPAGDTFFLRGFIASPIALLFSKLQDKTGATLPGKLIRPSVRLATHYYDTSNLQGTCVVLTAFVVEAGFLAYDKRVNEQMKSLIVDARAIKTALGCPNYGARDAGVAPVARSAIAAVAPAEERQKALAWFRERFGISANGALSPESGTKRKSL